MFISKEKQNKNESKVPFPPSPLFSCCGRKLERTPVNGTMNRTEQKPRFFLLNELPEFHLGNSPRACETLML